MRIGIYTATDFLVFSTFNSLDEDLNTYNTNILIIKERQFESVPFEQFLMIWTKVRGSVEVE